MAALTRKETMAQQRRAQAAERLAAMAVPAVSGWSKAPRDAARARLLDMGLPHRRDEYWKYTDPTSLAQPEPVEAATFDPQETLIFARHERLHLVFSDGIFDAEASDPLEGEGIEIARLAEAETADIHWAQDLYGTLEARGQQPVNRPLAALNSALAQDGVLIRVTGQVERPVHITYLRRDTASDVILHHVVKVEPGAKITLLENGPAAARLNTCLEVEVADGAAFHHIRAQGRDHERRAACHMFARLGEKSVFKSFTLTVNGVLTRNEAVIEFTGDDAVAHIAGAALGEGDYLHDDTVFITHDAVNCESRQVFKKVLRKGARGVFQGKILVKDGAQKTDGYQLSQALLLDDDAEFDAKPELEIYADDVACSHGSTTGAIDEEALFYLLSRGISKGEAGNLLVLAFLAEAIEEIEDDELASEITERLSGWLSRHSKD